MIKQLWLLALILTSLSSASQNLLVNKKNSYLDYVERLNNSKDLKFQEILNLYDAYIERNPKDITVQIYKCKFIGSAYYDAYEDYNLKYEETQECINALYDNYPTNADVLIYKIENTYDEKDTLIDEAIEVYEKDKSNWTYQQIGKLYELGANFYSETNDFKANRYAEKAEQFSDSLDLSVLLTNINLRLGDREKAKENLMSSLYVEHEAWVLNQKAELLVEFNELDEALKMFERVKEKDSTYINNDALYQVFIKNKKYEEARSYLLEDTIVGWNKTANIQKLLNHDMIYSDSDTALEVYRRMQEESYFDDFFGIKRLKLFLKSPFEKWTFNELSHVLILLAFILLLFLIPYLWVLPIFGAGKYFKLPRIKKSIKLPVDWSLKHFWLISFLYLLCQTILILVFYYQDYMNSYFEIISIYADDEIIESDLEIANSMLFFSGIMLISTVLFLNKKRLKFVLKSTLGFRQIIGFSILFLIAKGIFIKILRQFVDLSVDANLITSLDATLEINTLLSEYGFSVSVFVVALIVPFYEEIIFRGIMLSSTEKHLGFKWANVIQAVLFATVHYDLKLFVFYLGFGLLTGYAVKRTNGLFTGIIFHAVNNFAVLVALYYLMKVMPGFNY